MIIKKPIFSLTLSILISVSSMSYANDAGVDLSMEQAIEFALINNPELKSFGRNVDLAIENIDLSKSGIRPSVSAGGSFGYGWSDNKSDGGATNGVDKSANLSFVQPLYQGGRVLADIEEQENLRKAVEEQFYSKVQGKIIEVVDLYVQTYETTESIRVNKDNVNLLSEQLRATSARFEAGELTKTDVAQAEARLAESEANLAQAEAIYEVILSSLQEEIGVMDVPDVTYPDLDLNEIPQTLDSALSLGLRKNPKIIEVLATIEANKFNVKEQIRTLYPDLNLEGGVSASRNKSAGFMRSQDSANVGLSVSLPIYQGGALRNNIRQSKIRRAQAEDNLNDVRQSVRDDIISSWHQFKIIDKQITARKKQVEAAQLAYKGVKLEEDFGARSILDVLDANQDVRAAELSLIETRGDLVNAYYQLMGAMGLLVWDKS